MSVGDDEIESLYAELRQFRVPKDYRGNAKKNEFWAIEEDDLVNAERRMGVAIPCQLRKFYMVVGTGHLVRDRQDNLQDDYFNIFIDLQRLASFWIRDEVSFQYDDQIVDSEEMAFFDMGSYNYFVLRPNSDKPNAVYAPYDKKPIAQSFNNFVFRLYNDTKFYLNHKCLYGI